MSKKKASYHAPIVFRSYSSRPVMTKVKLITSLSSIANLKPRLASLLDIRSEIDDIPMCLSFDTKFKTLPCLSENPDQPRWNQLGDSGWI